MKGDRMRFFPVGESAVPGDRDIPSDTDSDGRDETFQMPKPNLNEYLKEYFSQEVVDRATDTWQKRVAEWDDLQTRAGKIKSAVFAEREDARLARKKLLELRKPQTAPLLPEFDYELRLSERSLREGYLEALLEARAQERARRARRELRQYNTFVE